jgi:methylene-tetrahydromethanopterin dehydrogenase
MKALELEPLSKKKLRLVMMESEFSIEWWIEPPPKEERDLFSSFRIVSKEYIKFVEDLIQQYTPHFAVEEKGLRTRDEFLYDNPLLEVFTQAGIPYQWVDISENALGYLLSTLEDRKNLLKGIKSELGKIFNKESKISDNVYLQQLINWGNYLQTDYKREEAEIRFKVREAWMMMGILELAQKREEKELTVLIICDKDHFEGITNLAEGLGIDVVAINLKKAFKNGEGTESLQDILNKSIYEIMPIKVKKKETAEKILYFFDTDEYASPFDINMAYDAGFNVVVPFSKVTAEGVTKLVQDAIFSRGPKAPTTFFVGGANVKEGEKIAKKVLKALVPPFEVPVIIDPRGSHTTASAVVVKTEAMARDHDMELAGKKVVVLGTGPVGRIAAILAAKLHCQTVLVETWDGASEASVKELAKDLTQEAGEDATEITGEFALTPERKIELLTDADIIWSVAAAGIEILSEEIMTQLPPNKLVIDINAVPPLGIAGLKSKDDNKEIFPGIYGTGALALGGLKYQIENNILKQAAATKGKQVFDYNLAFEVGRGLLAGKKILIAP